jgi:hypothetical protein
VGKTRVARIRRAAGIEVRLRRRFRRTADSEHNFPIARDVLNRQFSVKEIRRKDTLEGWLYISGNTIINDAIANMNPAIAAR